MSSSAFRIFKCIGFGAAWTLCLSIVSGDLAS